MKEKFFIFRSKTIIFLIPTQITIKNQIRDDFAFKVRRIF